MFIIKLNPSIMLVRVEVSDVVPSIVSNHTPYDVPRGLIFLLTYLQEVFEVNAEWDGFKHLL